MAIVVDQAIKSYEEFENTLIECGDTLIRQAPPLYEMLKDRCYGATVTFTFEPGCLVTMDVQTSNIVHKNEIQEDFFETYED